MLEALARGVKMKNNRPIMDNPARILVCKYRVIKDLLFTVNDCQVFICMSIY